MCGGLSLGLLEADMGMRLIRESVDPDAEIIFGTSINEELDDEIIITVIATDFQDAEVSVKSMNSSDSRKVYTEKTMPNEPKAPINKDDRMLSMKDIQVEIPQFLRRTR